MYGIIWYIYHLFTYMNGWFLRFYGSNVGNYTVHQMDPEVAIDFLLSHNQVAAKLHHHLCYLQVHLSISLKWSFLVGMLIWWTCGLHKIEGSNLLIHTVSYYIPCILASWIYWIYRLDQSALAIFTALMLVQRFFQQMYTSTINYCCSGQYWKHGWIHLPNVMWKNQLTNSAVLSFWQLYQSRVLGYDIGNCP